MENFAFKNYEEFKQLFPVKVSRDGSTYHQNKILLAFLLSRSVREWCKRTDNMYLLNTASMTSLRERCMSVICCGTRGAYRWILGTGFSCWTDRFKSDSYKGICMDMDINAIRYVNPENGRVFKKKAGRFFKAIALDTSFGCALPESVLLWLCEEFQQQWSAFAATQLNSKYTLHVDKDFDAIYSKNRCIGDFGSCMAGEGYYSFYEDAVKCHAAYLTDDNDDIVARCVIYDEVQDMNTGEIFRLAERQYATDGNIILKRMLVSALIKGGYIDGFKTPGADCHSPHAFETVSGKPLDNDFKIECNLEAGDTLSYQDSFKYFNEYKQEAYNDEGYNYDEKLTETGGVYRGPENYDDYHEEYTTNDLQRVYVGGREYYCDENRLYDFVWVKSDNEYHHIEDVFSCDRCGKYELIDNNYYSEITEEDYCCEGCRERAEEEYKEANWDYSSYDDEYYEDGVEPYYKLVRGDNGIDLVEIGTIHTDSIDSDFVEIDGCQILITESTLAVA